MTDMHTKLEYWDTFWSHLQPIVKLLEDRMYRERFLATCVRGTAAAEHEDSFQSMGMEKLYSKRWQVVIICLTKLLPMFTVFQQAWDETKYLADGDTDGNVARGVTAALDSSVFCSYVYMVYSLHRLVSKLEKWLEACPCHEHLAEDVKTLRKGQRKKVLQTLADCPMKGKRAAELACGSLGDTLEKLESFALQCFAEDPGKELNEQERNTVTKDFEYGRVFLRFGLSSKFNFWQQLPWKLCGLAHHWPSQARTCAQACLEEYQETQNNVRIQDEHHHPLTLEFLQAGTELRNDLERFASGGLMSQQLALACAPLKFVAVAERIVEGLTETSRSRPSTCH